MDAPGAPPSGLGTARPSFVSNLQVGATSTPAIPTLNAQQFGSAPNWAQTQAPQVQSALLQPRPRPED